jgi:hypothetical protein
VCVSQSVSQSTGKRAQPYQQQQDQSANNSNSTTPTATPTTAATALSQRQQQQHTNKSSNSTKPTTTAAATTRQMQRYFDKLVDFGHGRFEFFVAEALHDVLNTAKPQPSERERMCVGVLG